MDGTGQTLTQEQDEAFERLLEAGGDVRWVPISEVGPADVIDELEEMLVVQTCSRDKFVALDGFEPDAPEPPDDESSTDESDGADGGFEVIKGRDEPADTDIDWKAIDDIDWGANDD